ncbi:class II aldolase/adducin N-terminal [Gilbertella persicaria]|uniref:class II aldolase/adducin N-terminal n=1 Tax=Gilbertella persicaria TaxID=101096 RepID=UPI00221E43DD|nr:class II aldolase/adducin N-terminal [Gilbertella persicaria]KAI8071156.1 class II aldolase/adducin N-terminal [Gilbertella persicaria]
MAPPISEVTNEINKQMHAKAAIFLRSKRKIVLTGSETEEEAREAEKQPVFLPSLPQFDDVHSQRIHMKQKLAAGFRLLAKFGWDEGVAGHMTFRDPEYPDLFWVNAFGQYFGHIKASDLILVDHEGSIVRGNQMVNKAAFVIHAAVHQARPDIICAVHTHSIYGRTFSTLGRKLLPISQDACAFYGAHSVYEDFGGVVFNEEEGQRLVKALGPTNKALIMQNHGLLTTGKTVDEAIWAFIAMEKSCHSQLMAEAAHPNGYKDLKLIDDLVATQTYHILGDEKAGYAQFQPMYNMIVKEQPDCLE